MIVSNTYTVLLRLANIAGVFIQHELRDGSERKITVPFIVVEDGNLSPIRGSQREYDINIFHYDYGVIYVGSEWLQNNLSDDEMAQWVALRLLGMLDMKSSWEVRSFSENLSKVLAQTGVTTKQAGEAFNVLLGDVYA